MYGSSSFEAADKTKEAVQRAKIGIAAVIDNSKSKVLIVSGKLAHDVYGSEQVTNSIESALNRNVAFEIIVGPNIDPESNFIQERLKGKICHLQTWPQPHFVVGDSKHVRYEPKHEIHDAPAAPNTFVIDAPEVAKILVAKFKELKLTCPSPNTC